MFVRNKIYWYSSRLNPSFPPPTTAAASSGTAPTLVPFYLRRVSTPSASPSKPPPSYRTPACAPFPSPSFRHRHEPYPIHPGPGQSPTLQRSATAVMAAVTESIKVVLMRLNCRRYCRPLLPPTPAPPPLFVQRLRRRFNPTLSFRYISLSRFLLRPLPCHHHAPGSLSPPLWISFFPLNLRLWIAPTSISPAPSFSLLIYPSFLKLRLKLYNEHTLYRVSRHNLLSLFLTSWDTCYSVKRLDVLVSRFWMPPRIYVGKQSLRAADIRQHVIEYRSCLNPAQIYRISANLHWNWFSRLEFIRKQWKAPMMNRERYTYICIV